MTTVYVNKKCEEKVLYRDFTQKMCQFKEEVNKVLPQNIKSNFTFPDVERIISTMVSEGGAGAD